MQVKRLERICKELGESPRGKKCVGMEGLIEEAKELLSEKPEPNVLDAGLISGCAARRALRDGRLRHRRTWARLLGYENQAQLLQQTLDEEQATDLLLTDIASRRSTSTPKRRMTRKRSRRHTPVTHGLRA